MPAIGFNQSSILSSGGQSFALSSLISVPAGQNLPPTLLIRAYDRDVYAGQQNFDYGSFSSPKGGTVSAGTAYQATLLYFDLKDGVYVSRDTGEALADYRFTSSAQNFRSVYLSLFTADSKDASFAKAWLDPSWNHLADLDVVTRTNFVDPTPNLATPEEIAAIAKSFVGQIWNKEGCWLLTSNISAAAGASLPVNSTFADTAHIGANGQWQVVYNGSQQHEDWRSYLQVGDMIELVWSNGDAHIATITSGSGLDAMWVDNSGVSANTGTPSDIIIQGEHAVKDLASFVVKTSVVIFRLASNAATSNALPTPVAAPLVTPHAQSLKVGDALSVASLFSVQDPNLLAMSSYRIEDLNGAGHIALNGAINLASAAQQQAGVVIVSATDLAKLSYTASLGPDALTITAFNGQSWGTARVTVTGWIDPPPVVTGASLALHASGQLTPVGSLFGASAAPGHTITQYRVIDLDNSGQLLMRDARLNLASNEEAAQGIYRVKAGDLSALNWKTLANTGNLSVSAFDGTQWSDFVTVTVAGQNAAPTVTALTHTQVSIGDVLPVTSLFKVSDLDGDAVKMVTILDFNDNIHLNGATDYCPFPHAYEIALNELGKVTFSADAVNTSLVSLLVNAYDGTTWSNFTSLQFTLAEAHPSVLAARTDVAPGGSIKLDQAIRVVDPNGKAIVQYTVQDPSGGGSLQLNGAANLASASQQAAGVSVFAAADLPKVSYAGAGQAGTEVLTISASNGAWTGSATISFYTTDYSAAIIFPRKDYNTLDIGRTVKFTDLFTVGAQRPITQYLIRDDAGGGSILLNGARDLGSPDGVLIAAADISKVKYISSASAGSETLHVSVFDGSVWGRGDVLIMAKDYERPVVTGSSITLHAGESVALQTLFKVTNVDPDAILGYQINDLDQRLDLNGAINTWAAEQYKGYYTFKASDLNKIAYVAGAPGTYTIYAEAGAAQGKTSFGDAIEITVLPTPVVTPSTVTLTPQQTVAVSNLFGASTPSGHSIVRVKFATQDHGGELHLNGALNLATSAERAQGISIVSAADLALLSYTAANAFNIDNYTVSVFDGESWGSAKLPVTTIDGTPPRMTSLLDTVEVHSTVALTSLFSAVSHSGLPITQYKITNPNGGGKLVLNGAANSATAAEQGQKGMAIVAAADIGKLQYVGADLAGSETISIAAFDGQSWGSVDIQLASVQTAAPVITPALKFVDTNTSIRLADLYSVSAPGGKAPAYYIFQDGSGSIELNGAVNAWAGQQSAGYYWISAQDIGKVLYHPNYDGVYRVNVLVNDGLNFSSWASALAVAGKERLSLPPALTPGDTTVALNQQVSLASLFAVQDPLGLGIVSYKIHDAAGGGSVVLNGALDLATSAEHAQGLLVFAGADLAKVTYLGAAQGGAETISISAFDGQYWGSGDIAVTSAVLPPQVRAGLTGVELGQAASLASLFSVSAASGKAIVQYKIQDPTGGGSVVLNGAVDLADAAQRAQGISIISALDLGKLQYQGAGAAGNETLLFGAYDGSSWGASNLVVTTRDSRAPSFSTGDVAVDLGVPVALNKIVQGISVSGRAIVQYQIQDPSGGGQLLLNAAHNLATPEQQALGITVVAGYDLDNLLYKGGAAAGTENLQITAYDGQNSTSMAVAIKSVPSAPVRITPTPVTVHTGDVLHLADLVSMWGPNGHTIGFIRLIDTDLGIRLNGAVNIAVSPLYDYTSLYDFSSVAEFNKIDYVAQQPGVLNMVYSIYDGFNVTNAEQRITILAKDQPIPVVAVANLTGSGAADLLRPQGSKNAIDGGAGLDTLVYGGKGAAYAISISADGSVSVRSASGVVDSLRNVERLQFDDVRIALDVGVNHDTATAGQVYRLYQAAFDRSPDLAGLSYWIGKADAHVALASIAADFVASAEFTSTYGGLSNHDFVDQMYHNVLHRAGDAAGMNYWENLLDQGAANRAQILVGFADSQENQVALIGLLQHGIVVSV